MAGSKQIYITDLPDTFTAKQLEAVFAPYGTITWSKVLPAKGKGKGKGCKALIEYADANDSAWIVENMNGNIPEGLEQPVKVEFSTSKGTGVETVAKTLKDAISAALGNKGKGEAQPAAGKGNAAAGKGAASSFGKAASGKGAQASSPYGAGKENGKGKAAAAAAAEGKAAAEETVTMKSLLKGAVKGGITPWGDRPTENTLYVKGLPSDCTDADLYSLFAPFGAIPPSGVLAQKKKEGGESWCTGVGFVDFVERSAAEAATQALNGFTSPDESVTLEVSQKQAAGGGKGGKAAKGAKGASKGKGKW